MYVKVKAYCIQIWYKKLHIFYLTRISSLFTVWQMHNSWHKHHKYTAAWLILVQTTLSYYFSLQSAISSLKFHQSTLKYVYLLTSWPTIIGSTKYAAVLASNDNKNFTILSILIYTLPFQSTMVLKCRILLRTISTMKNLHSKAVKPLFFEQGYPYF